MNAKRFFHHFIKTAVFKKMRLNKVKTHKGKKYLDDRSPKLEENDKAALIVRGPKANEMVTKALHEFYLLKKPLAQRLMR
jgi:hypothetical protein